MPETSWRAAPLFWGSVLFAMFGLCVEIVFTGLFAGFDESFVGHVSLLMIPVYALAYCIAWPLFWTVQRLELSRIVRIPLTVLLIYALEWSFGATYLAMGLEPWHYDHGWASDWSGGLITLYYLPAWTLFAMLILRVWRVVHTVSPHLDTATRQKLFAPPYIWQIALEFLADLRGGRGRD